MWLNIATSETCYTEHVCAVAFLLCKAKLVES